MYRAAAFIASLIVLWSLYLLPPVGLVSFILIEFIIQDTVVNFATYPLSKSMCINFPAAAGGGIA